MCYVHYFIELSNLLEVYFSDAGSEYGSVLWTTEYIVSVRISQAVKYKLFYTLYSLYVD